MAAIVSAINPGAGGGGPQRPDLQTPATVDQANAQYGNVQQGLTQQQRFLQALQAQNGIGNQSQVFNQLNDVVNGTGANPAQAMLANQTASNTANQAALMAGQRGASANPALIARQAAMQGSANQQNAIGQGAALQAQQSLGALNTQGQLASQQVAQQGNAQNAYNQQALAGQQNILGAIGNQNNAQVGATNSINQANTANNGAANAMFGNLMGAAGTAAGMYFGGPAGAAVGGQIAGSAGRAANHPQEFKAEGGMIGQGPKSMAARHMMAEGGKVPAMVSPGEVYLPPAQAQAAAKGQVNPIKAGEKIPGTPKVAGNSYANDTVPKTLTEGGVVIPNSIMQSKDADKKAAEFVRQVMAKKGLRK